MYDKTAFKTKTVLVLLLALAALSGCRQRDTFCIEGNISGAADTMLYLEHLTLGEGAVAIDSIRLKEDGAFRFTKKRVGNPEFYRLRIGGQAINLGIDSTETVRVTASLDSMSFGYRVEGSGTCDTIRLLCLKRRQQDAAAAYHGVSDTSYDVAAHGTDVKSHLKHIRVPVAVNDIRPGEKLDHRHPERRGERFYQRDVGIPLPRLPFGYCLIADVYFLT
jgi:hypothetical protein